MAPKKVGRSASAKKVSSATASKKEQKKQVSPPTKETCVPTDIFFGGKKTTPAAAAVSAGDQAGSSTSASLGSVPPRKLRSKTMSAAAAATLVVQSPSTSDVGSSQESTIQSTPGVTQLTSFQQPQPQRQPQPHVQLVQAQVHGQGEAQVEAEVEPQGEAQVVPQGEAQVEPQGEAQGEAHGQVHGKVQLEVHGAAQLPTTLVPPEVGAHQEIDIQEELSSEEATHPDDDYPLSSRSPARKRSRRDTTTTTSSSSSPLPSDDLDRDLKPAMQSESESRHEPTKVAKPKRKAPAKLPLMGDDDELEVVSSAADEQSDDDPVITVITPAPAGMQQTDIFTLARMAAVRDMGGVALVPPPLTTTPTRPPAPIFFSQKGRHGPPSSSTSSSGAVSEQQKRIQPRPSSTSSGIESQSSTSTFSRHHQSPVWDFFTVSQRAENMVVCSICKVLVSRGKLGTNCGTGGQRGHLKQHHTIIWEARMRKIEEGKRKTNPNVSLDIASDDDERLIVQGGSEEATDIFSGTPSSAGSGTAVVSPTPSTPATSLRHTKTVGETPMRKTTSMGLTGLKTSSSSSTRKMIQPTIRQMLRSEAPFERNHPTNLVTIT
ncbi:uncharacterized protein LOC144752591 [Lissotriton helveticus]